VRLGAAVYAVCCASLFGVSALYHRPEGTAVKRRWMRRLDHATIFVMIAGTGTPFAMSLSGPARSRLLLIFWAGAAVGVVRAVAWIGAPKPLVAVLAVALGWAAWPFVPQLTQRLGVANLVLVVVGGIIYSLGALIYALKWPRGWPRVFGYHELFHAFVIVAAVVHFVAVARVVLIGR